MDFNKIEELRLRVRRDSEVGIHGILDSLAIRYYEEQDEIDYIDIRSPFFRDIDRIVHSKAYARYIDKSQVFFDVKNANITHRSLHVALVSRVAELIGRVLKLNIDLAHAISLAHDVGHAPGGHSAEIILDSISKKYNLGGYSHNAQGIRWLHYLEKRFPKKPAQGLNLTLQVLDGILCHDGEIYEQKLKPKKINGKTWNDHFKEYDDCFNDNTIKRIPMSYEGVIVRFADTISYIGRDIEDAILLKFIKRSDIPENCRNTLGDTNRNIMHTLIMDLIDFSLENDGEYIGYSEEIFEAIKELKTFNYENIYHKRDLIRKGTSQMTFVDKLTKKYELIFEKCLEELEQKNYNAPIFKDHIEYIDDETFSTYFKPLKNQGNLTFIVRDYIAGMSDKYFKEIYDKYHKN